MNKKQMYSSRYRHMVKACRFVVDNPCCGNTEIANAIGLSRQAINRIMRDALQRGWVTVEEIQWRSNAVAKRYSIGRYYPFATS